MLSFGLYKPLLLTAFLKILFLSFPLCSSLSAHWVQGNRIFLSPPSLCCGFHGNLYHATLSQTWNPAAFQPPRWIISCGL
ncbi:hypothetical protein K438DRAFT_716643 [Mycena galopus ATCC 62051]|nr:hypothetical protein K438DRAFT_716643 [Mycena galopus ATCC 62051]